MSSLAGETGDCGEGFGVGARGFRLGAAVELWGVSWANNSICFFTDNEALVTIINKQTSREACVKVLLRKLISTCLRCNINLTARHVPCRYNALADKLSRCQIKEFRTMVPWVNCEPATVPFHISPATLGTL